MAALQLFFPLCGHGEGGGACPSCIRVKGGSTPERVTSSLQGPMWAFASCTLLEGTSVVLWTFPNTFHCYQEHLSHFVHNRTRTPNPLLLSMVTYYHRSLLNLFIIVRKEFIRFNIMNQHSLNQCAVCSLFVLRYVSDLSLHLSSQPLAQLFILWMGQHNATTLFPFWGSLGTTLYRRQFMVSRSHAPSGTPTNRSRGSCG